MPTCWSPRIYIFNYRYFISFCIILLIPVVFLKLNSFLNICAHSTAQNSTVVMKIAADFPSPIVSISFSLSLFLTMCCAYRTSSPPHVATGRLYTLLSLNSAFGYSLMNESCVVVVLTAYVKSHRYCLRRRVLIAKRLRAVLTREGSSSRVFLTRADV